MFLLRGASIRLEDNALMYGDTADGWAIVLWQSGVVQCGQFRDGKLHGFGARLSSTMFIVGQFDQDTALAMKHVNVSLGSRFPKCLDTHKWSSYTLLDGGAAIQIADVEGQFVATMSDSGQLLVVKTGNSGFSMNLFGDVFSTQFSHPDDVITVSLRRNDEVDRSTGRHAREMFFQPPENVYATFMSSAFAACAPVHDAGGR